MTQKLGLLGRARRTAYESSIALCRYLGCQHRDPAVQCTQPGVKHYRAHCIHWLSLFHHSIHMAYRRTVTWTSIQRLIRSSFGYHAFLRTRLLMVAAEDRSSMEHFSNKRPTSIVEKTQSIPSLHVCKSKETPCMQMLSVRSGIMSPLRGSVFHRSLRVARINPRSNS
jgi:hypothetical protein